MRTHRRARDSEDTAPTGVLVAGRRRTGRTHVRKLLDGQVCHWLGNQHLNTQAVTELGYFKNFFNGICWYNLVPDQIAHTPDCWIRDIRRHRSRRRQRLCDWLLNAGRSLAVIYTPVSPTMTVAMSKFRGSGNGEVVRSNQRHIPNSFRLAISKHRQPQFRYAGKQQRWRSRLGFALAGSIRFANADPNSYRYIHANTDSHTATHTPTATPTATFTPTPTADGNSHPDYLRQHYSHLQRQPTPTRYTDAYAYANTVPYSYGYTNKLYCP